MYHRWAGQTPILARMPPMIRVEDNIFCSVEEARRIRIDAKICTMKYVMVAFSLFILVFDSWDTKKHIARVFASNSIHTINHLEHAIPEMVVTIKVSTIPPFL